MHAREVVLLAIGIICIVAFAWSLTIMCTSPTLAHSANWLSTLGFASLGPIWATQHAGPVVGGRMIAAFATVVISFFGVLIARRSNWLVTSQARLPDHQSGVSEQRKGQPSCRPSACVIALALRLSWRVPLPHRSGAASAGPAQFPRRRPLHHRHSAAARLCVL
jgi:hypothetical protein